jgi:hypothetical protein
MAEAPPIPALRSRDRPGRLCLAGILNLPLALVVSHGLVAMAPAGTTALGWTALILGWLSTLASLTAIALLLLAPQGFLPPLGWRWRTGIAAVALAVLAASGWDPLLGAVLLGGLAPAVALPRRWLVPALTIAGFGLLQVALYGDVVVFGLFRMHYNQMVWDALTAPGASDSLTLGRGTMVSIALVVAGIIAAEAGIAWLALRPAALRFAGWRWLTATLLGAVLVVAADKALYAWGDLAGRTEVTRIERHFPLYQRLTIHRIAIKRGWKRPSDDGMAVREGSSGLRYPRNPVPLPAQPRRLNVVILAIEGCRFDMLDPQVMPHLHAFAQQHTWGRNHFSGGNATRFGIFSLLYGMHATYWQQVVAERQGPFLIHALKQLGYRITVQACTDLNFPEFRQTAFVEVPEAITDRWPDLPRVERDRAMTDNLVRAIGEAGDGPFFAFGFYDASHSSYIYPPEHAVFAPVDAERSVDFLKIAGGATVEGLRPLANRYRNSLHYVDAQIARVLAELERRQLLDRTLLFIAGDHGEEFGELGFYGHNGTFDRFQTQTAFVASIPGMAPGPIDRLTSHIDVVPTILTALGFDGPPADYCNGLPLDRPEARDHLMTVSWDSLGVLDGETVMVRGLGGNALLNDLFDRDYRPLPAAEATAALQARTPRLARLVQEMCAFSQ